MTRVRMFCLLMLVLALAAGCSTPSAEVTITPPDDEAAEATCFANQQSLELQVRTKMTQTDDPVPSSLAKLADEAWISAQPACPAGGTYDWDAATTRLSCSIHGHYQ
ncbi:MAG: hypothetical protein ACYCX5_08535 [Coriobacteriia bacterium]